MRRARQTKKIDSQSPNAWLPGARAWERQKMATVFWPQEPLRALILPTDLFEIFFRHESAAMYMLELKLSPAVTGAVTAMGMWLVSQTLPTFSFAPLRVVAGGMGLTGVVITGLAMLSEGAPENWTV